MGKNGQLTIADLSYRPGLTTPVGMDLMDFLELGRRALSRGLDLTAPQRASFPQLITVHSGALPVTVDFTGHTLHPGDWMWVRPGQVRQFGHDPGTVQGTVVIWQPGFIDSPALAAIRSAPPYAQRPIVPEGPHQEAVHGALHHLRAEFEDLTSLPLAVHMEVIRAQLTTLVLRLAHSCGEPLAPAVRDETFVRFHEAVERNFAHTRRVEHYARALGFSVRTLTRASRAATGRPAKAYIDRRVLLEAKRLLVHTSASVPEIAADLGFRDAGDFTKFFRRLDSEARTPCRFRSVAQGRSHGPPRPHQAE